MYNTNLCFVSNKATLCQNQAHTNTVKHKEPVHTSRTYVYKLPQFKYMYPATIMVTHFAKWYKQHMYMHCQNSKCMYPDTTRYTHTLRNNKQHMFMHCPPSKYIYSATTRVHTLCEIINTLWNNKQHGYMHFSKHMYPPNNKQHRYMHFSKHMYPPNRDNDNYSVLYSARMKWPLKSI